MIKMFKDWCSMMSVAALSIGVFKDEISNQATFVGIITFIISIVLSRHLERRNK